MQIYRTTFLNRTFFWVLALISSVSWCVADEATKSVEPKPMVNDALTPLPAGSIQLSGPIGDAIETCIQGRIYKQSLPDLLGPFEERPETRLWRSEFWGKWFTSAVGAYEYQSTPELKEVVDRAVKGLMATQTDDGYIGTYQKSAELEGWDVWGRKYVLLGLLAYYDATGDQTALDAACREADYTMSQIGPGKRDIVKLGMWTGMAASSILEPVCLLYRRTGEKRYLDFAQYIVNQWKEPAGPDLIGKATREMAVYDMFPKPKKVMKDYGDGGQSKAYEMMSCFEGLTELHRITGQEEYIDAVKKVFDNIDATEITVLGSGSNWERWCNGHVRQTEPFHEWMETCVTVTWVKFATQLLRLTGDPAYADRIERSAYNALLGAQKGDGTWWSHSNPLVGYRGPAPEQCSMHMNCCVANGPRALMLLPKLAVMQGETGPTVLFYENGTASVPLASGKKLQLQIQGDYPYKNRVEIQVQPEAAETFTLSLRIPAWSQQTQLEINGEKVSRRQAWKLCEAEPPVEAGRPCRVDVRHGRA